MQHAELQHAERSSANQRMLEVEHISKSFGALAAVTDLAFTVEPGGIFGLLGPNGAGKTTTIRMVLDILEPDSGRVRWLGKRVDAEARHTFGYLPEERGLYPRMRVNDQLVFFAKLHGMPKSGVQSRISELAEFFQLGDGLRKTPNELSKGNQQKVQFMAAIAHRPPLLVLDEPFTALDPVNVEVFKTAIRELAAAGSTVLLSSHRMEQVEELCRDICIIDHSRAVVGGRLAEIKRNWPNRSIRMTAVGDMEFLKTFAGVSVTASADGMASVTLPADVAPADILRAAVAHGPVDHFEVVEPSLNDIYLHFVKPESAVAEAAYRR